MGADMNHLCPVSAYSSPALGSARVVLARTSVPPCFSVIPMPRVTAVFSQNGRKRESYSRERIFGSHSASRFGAAASAATEAWVMVIGQT